MSLDDVDRLVAEVSRRDAVELLGVAAAWTEVDEEHRAHARLRAREVATATDRVGELEETTNRISDLVTRLPVITGMEDGVGMSEFQQGAILREVGPALLDAAIGLLLRDELDAESLRALVGPWEETIGAFDLTG